DFPRDAFAPGSGDDAWLERANGAARGAVSVRVVYRGGSVVRVVAVASSPGRAGSVGGQARRIVLGRPDSGSPVAVGGMGFCNPRSCDGLCETQTSIPTVATRRLDPGSLTMNKWEQVELRARTLILVRQEGFQSEASDGRRKEGSGRHVQTR